MKLPLFLKKIQRQLSLKKSRFNRSARMFIPGIGKKLIVVPFTTLSIIPIALLIIVSGYLLVRSDVFLVKDIAVTVEGGIEGDAIYAEGIAPAEDIKSLVNDHVIAHSLWNINKASIEKDVRQEYPSVQSVTVETSIPDTVSVLVKERVAIAQIAVQRRETTPDGKELSKEEYYLVDENGGVYLQVNRKVALPVFIYPNAFEELENSETLLGYTFPESLVPAVVEVIRQIEDYGRFEMQEVLVKDERTLIVKTSGDIEIVLGLDQNINEQIDKLEVVHEQIVYSGRTVSFIDTRFDKTVVRYK